jgi:hypothetical protein
MHERIDQRPSWVWTVGPGDRVTYQDRERRVTALKLDGADPPYFRLEGTAGDLISYREVRLPRVTAAPRGGRGEQRST